MDNSPLLVKLLTREFQVGDLVSWRGHDGKLRYGVVDALHKSAANTVRVKARNHNAYWKNTSSLRLATHA